VGHSYRIEFQSPALFGYAINNYSDNKTGVGEVVSLLIHTDVPDYSHMYGTDGGKVRISIRPERI
jgi:hypothetical protein